jgi:glycosyltransferase involved in cell wall biosynthesis
MHDHFEREPGYRVSIIIPARNQVRNLPRVLEALPAGLHEVIVVDGRRTILADQAITEINLVREST